MSVEVLKAERERVQAELKRVEAELAEALKAAHHVQVGDEMKNTWNDKRGKVTGLRVGYDKVWAYGFVYLKDGSFGRREVSFYGYAGWKKV